MGACCDSSGSDMRPAPSGGIVKHAGGPSGQTIKVEYFDLGFGRADPIVQLLKHKGVAFEYVQVSQESWGTRKAAGDAGEMGGLPIVHIGGQSRQQTNAILRSFGIQHGYYNPTDWKSAGIADVIIDSYTDTFGAIAKVLFMQGDEEKAAELESVKNGILTKFLTIVEK